MKNNQYSVRPATQSDIPALAALADQLGYAADSAAIAPRLQALQGSSDHAVWVAEIDGRVRGWVHVFRALRVESDAFAEIGGLVVDQAVRGGGLGRVLVKVCEDWARAQGLHQLRVRSNAVRLTTHEFYQHLGFAVQKSQQVFMLAL